MKQKLLLTLTLFLTLGFVASCSTIEGAGRDIENAGEWIQEKTN